MDSERDDDRRLAARAGAGDERAFAELVERHREPLLRYVGAALLARAGRGRGPGGAALRAPRARDRDAPADVRAWLSTIAWRRALDMTRRERDALPLDADVAAAPAHEPEARAIQANELGRVVAAFSELPERQRAALTLSALEGRSLEEIGDALDVDADTAKSLVARSRRTLTHRLAAAELCCDGCGCRWRTPRARGVRLSGDVTLHLRDCRALRAGAPRDPAPPAPRVALVIPFGLAVRTAGLRDRLRDLIAFNPAWEAQVSAAKLCTAACLTAVGAGSAAAPAIVVLPPRPTPRSRSSSSRSAQEEAQGAQAAPQADGDGDPGRDDRRRRRDPDLDPDARGRRRQAPEDQADAGRRGRRRVRPAAPPRRREPDPGGPRQKIKTDKGSDP